MPHQRTDFTHSTTAMSNCPDLAQSCNPTSNSITSKHVTEVHSYGTETLNRLHLHHRQQAAIRLSPFSALSVTVVHLVGQVPQVIGDGGAEAQEAGAVVAAWVFSGAIAHESLSGGGGASLA